MPIFPPVLTPDLTPSLSFSHSEPEYVGPLPFGLFHGQQSPPFTLRTLARMVLLTYLLLAEEKGTPGSRGRSLLEKFVCEGRTRDQLRTENSDIRKSHLTW